MDSFPPVVLLDRFSRVNRQMAARHLEDILTATSCYSAKQPVFWDQPFVMGQVGKWQSPGGKNLENHDFSKFCLINLP